LYKYLLNKGNKSSGREKRKKQTKRQTWLKNENRKNIKERCKQANERLEAGHFEADLIVPAKGRHAKKVILTFTDRKTRKEFAIFCKDKSANEIFIKTLLLRAEIGEENIKSITYDNGLEFAKYSAVETQLKCQVYFANPFHSFRKRNQ